MTKATFPAPSSEAGPIAAGELARLVGGRLEGDPAGLIRAVASPGRDDEGCAVCLFSRKAFRDLASCSAALLVIPDDEAAVREAKSARPDAALLITSDPELAQVILLEAFHPATHPFSGVSPEAFVEEGAVIGEGAAVAPLAYVCAGAIIGARSVLYPHVYIGPGAVIGDDCLLRAGAIVERGCLLGDRVILQPNAVIGGDGFGYLRRGGSYRKKPQVGRVVVGDDVEIGANTTIDRASIGETRIGRGTKIDNLVQVAHNVTVGENVILVAQVGVAGSTSIGHGSIMAGQSGVADHISIGSGVVVGARGGVMRDVPDGMAVHGFPAIEGRTWLKQTALIQALPELRKRVTELEARLKAMEADSNGL